MTIENDYVSNIAMCACVRACMYVYVCMYACNISYIYYYRFSSN